MGSAYIIPSVGTFLEAVLCWRFASRRLWIHWPYFAVFVFFTFLRDVSLFPVSRYEPRWFAGFYWRGETISLFLRFLVVWEFFRGLFPERSSLHELAWKVLMSAELVILPALLLLSWSQTSSTHLVYAHLSPAFEQYLSLAQVLLLLGPAALARYYGVSLGRNVWGMGLGFGIYLSVCSMNFAGLQISHNFAPYWRLLSPLTFMGMIVLWLWALWDYEPTPNSAEEPLRLEKRVIDSSARN
jgi:hypothetical protein